MLVDMLVVGRAIYSFNPVIQFLSTPVLMHVGLLCIAFCPSVCLSVCHFTKNHWTKIQLMHIPVCHFTKSHWTKIPIMLGD